MIRSPVPKVDQSALRVQYITKLQNPGEVASADDRERDLGYCLDLNIMTSYFLSMQRLHNVKFLLFEIQIFAQL